MVSLGQKLKMPKCEKPFYKIIRVVLCKKLLEKHKIFEKWDDFENGAKGESPCKGLCKMVRLGQKLKMPKTCDKRFHNIIRVVLCKHTKCSRNETILKVGLLAKARAHANTIAFAKWSV